MRRGVQSTYPSVAHAARHGRVGVPAAAAEQRRREPALAQPGALAQHARARLLAACRSCVGRARPVRVVPERASRGGLAGALEPARVVLAGRLVRRPEQRGDREAARPSLLQAREGGPHPVVERPFDVAGDDRVPFPGRAHRAPTHTTDGRVSRRKAVLVVAAAAALPRLAALAVERGTILEEYVEKSDTFARTLVASGTFGFLPDIPSAYTQPLYAFFLAGLYWPFGASWVAVGLAQIAVAVGTALLVLEIGRRLRSHLHRRHGGARRDAASVPRLARHPRQP